MRDSSFPQAGETRCGEPTILRSITFDTELYAALKVVLLSFDSTIRSNLAVGLPLDLIVLRRDAIRPELVDRVEADDPYFRDLRERWSEAPNTAMSAIPNPSCGYD